MWSSFPPHLARADSRFVPPHEWLENSYARCITSNVPRDLSRIQSFETVSPPAGLHYALSAYAHLLFSETHNCLSNQRSIMLLTDPNAMVIDLYARPEILQILAQQHGIAIGVRLVEEVCGTNAVVLGLRYRAGVVLRSSQHYCRIFQDWYSVAMPLNCGDGSCMGCVSMATEDSDTIMDVAALVKFMAEDLNRFCQANRNLLTTTGDSPARLTQRQQQVLEHFALGMSYKEIARALGIRSVKTIEEHLDAVRSKLNASCRRECIRRAAELGLLRM